MMKKILYSILIFLFIFFLWLLYCRFIGTVSLKTNEITIYSSIDTSYDGLKVIHFSDLHYKKIITEERVQDLITEINRNKPDLVIFTGDLIDSDYELTNSDINFLIECLSEIDATYGKFAVMGDNDYSAEDTISNIYIQSGFTLLKNSYSIIHNESNEKIFIGGIDSYLEGSADIDKVMSYFEENDNINYKIILVHEPDYIDTILEKYDNIPLILSGHSINGSINIPGVKKLFLPDGALTYYKPYYKIDNTDIYISNGIGVEHYNFRFLNTPSINFYRIKRSN